MNYSGFGRHTSHANPTINPTLARTRWLLLGVAATLVAMGCATTPSGRATAARQGPAFLEQSHRPPDRPGYERIRAEALFWRRKAAAVSGEWRDVGPLLDEAAQAAAVGDYARAVDLAERARFQAEMGYHQRMNQDKVENPPYLY